MSDEKPEKPKIIVDEDWKSQVQAEKQSAEHATTPDAEAPPNLADMPPASFEGLMSMLAAQAIAALGQGAAPDQEQVVVDLGYAKHMIDLLAMLEEKTKGNLSQEESAMLSHLLHELRLMFVAVKQHAKPMPPEPGSSIVTE